MNGFIWAAWGVYDFFLATKEKAAQATVRPAVETLRRNLDRYDLGFWSLYEQSGTRLPMVASPFYHQLHVAQLRTMHRLTGDDVFSAVRRPLGDVRPQPEQADSRPMLQGRFQALLLLGTVKILYVSQYFPPEMGAPAARVAELSRYWAQDGHDVTVLTGFPNHPTGTVPPEYRRKFRHLSRGRKLTG